MRAQLPQINKYYVWKNGWLYDHPDTIPWMVSEQSELAGQSTDVQNQVIKYRAEKDRQYPGIDQTWDEYFAAANRREFWSEHPELEAYMKWQREMAAEVPEAAAYIMSDTSLQKAILGDDYNSAQFANDPLSTVEIAEIGDALLQQLYGYMYGGSELGAGATNELSRIMGLAGRDMSVEDYIEYVIKPFMIGQ